jgi:DNA (cytosine-5)-methyltransferase 1
VAGALPFTFADLFAGIGGIRKGLEKVGGKCLISSEWDPHSQKTYKAWFGELPHGEITNIPVADIPDHDILAGGFPCQPFSIAGVSKKTSLGKAHGFKCLTQGTLFFHIVSILEIKRPPIVLLENVKILNVGTEVVVANGSGFAPQPMTDIHPIMQSIRMLYSCLNDTSYR